MTTSEKGIALIKKYEGCMLNAYKCPSGIWTIGYGHTNGVKQGDKITKSKAESLLKSDLKLYESKVMKYDNIYHFKQYEFDSLVSFAYNVGNIDTLTRKGTRTRKEIAKAMLLYCKGGGTILKGLEKRRNEEQEMFLGYAEYKLYKVTAVSGLNCRQKADENSKLIGTFKHGTVLKSFSDCGKWVKVSGKDAKGKTVKGYVSSKYITCIVNSKVLVD